MDTLADQLGESATCRKDEEEPRWSIEPRRPDASPMWFAGSTARDLTVGFGRAGSRVEWGFSRHVSDDEAIGSLTQLGMAVIGGGLVEWRMGTRSTRWRVALPDGSTEHGFSELAWADDALDAGTRGALPAVLHPDLGDVITLAQREVTHVLTATECSRFPGARA